MQCVPNSPAVPSHAAEHQHGPPSAMIPLGNQWDIVWGEHWVTYSRVERWHRGQEREDGPSAFPLCSLILYVLHKFQHNEEFGSATNPSALNRHSGLQEGMLLGTTPCLKLGLIQILLLHPPFCLELRPNLGLRRNLGKRRKLSNLGLHSHLSLPAYPDASSPLQMDGQCW